MVEPYEWLLFDADGTLFDYRRAESEALAATFLAADLRLDEDAAAAYAAINGELWAAFERGEVDQVRLRVARFERLAVHLGIDVDVEWWAGVYLAAIGQGAHLLPGAAATVETVSAGHRLALITNGLRDVQRSRLALSPIGPMFEVVVISEEVGAAKPDPAIFDAAFEAMGTPDPAAVLMIGDSLSADIAGGLAYGMDTCWVNPGAEPAPDGWDITHQVAGPADVLRLPGVLSG